MYNQGQNYNNSYQNDVNTNVIWIQGGINTVKSAMTPNSSQYAFFDQDEDHFYMKTVDQYGKSTVDPYVYFLESEFPQIIQQYIQTMSSSSQGNDSVKNADNNTVYVTQEQFEELKESLSQQIAETKKIINDFKSRVGNMNKKENK